MFRASQRQIRLHRRTQRIYITIGVPACQHVAAIRQRFVILIIEILGSERPIPVAGAALIRNKQIFRNRVRLIPRISFRRILAPPSPMLYGLSRQMGQRSVGCPLQNRKGVRIPNVLVRIHQPADEFVVAISREAILLVKVPRDRLRIQAIQPQNLISSRRRAGDRISPCQRGNPLPKSGGWSEARNDGVRVVVRIVAIPPAQIRARRWLPSHLAKWFQ